MALITGTTGTDTLLGTSEADILQPFSTDSVDVLQGLDGADVYDLRRSGTSMTYNVLIDDAGTDGAANTIINVGSLYHSSSFGYSGYATALRVGNDLIIHTPSRPYRFRQPAQPDFDIKIVDQYGGGHVSSITAGGTTYNLSLDFNGTEQADLMAGTNKADVINTGGGDDWVFGNGGRDEMHVGDGNDVVFGGNGRDTITASSGNNTIFGENGADRITTGAGADRIEGGLHNDKVWAGSGNDMVYGQEGNDRLRGQGGDDLLVGGEGNDVLVGGNGRDTLDSGAGNDRMIGGKGGDTYVFSTDEAGVNTIIDKGNAPFPNYYATAKNDVVVINGFGSIDEAMHGTSVEVAGSDLILTVENTADTPGVLNQITITNQFAGPRYAIEKIAFGTSNLNTDFNIVQLKGDQNTFSIHTATDVGGNDIVLGTAGDDVLYGGINNNIYLGGTGADIFQFKDQEDNRGGLDLILDFDLTEDIIDFSEIKALDRSGITISDNSAGNAVISSAYETIELDGISAATVTDDIFLFFA